MAGLEDRDGLVEGSYTLRFPNGLARACRCETRGDDMKKLVVLLVLMLFPAASVYALGGGGGHGDGRWDLLPPQSSSPSTSPTQTSVFNFSSDRIWVTDYQGATVDCWAAADSNVLAWTGWAPAGLSSQQIFNQFYSAYGSVPNAPYQGMYWYFNNEIPGVTASILPQYYSYMQGWSIPAMERAINEQRGVVLALWNDQTQIGHSVTLWGYQLNADGSLSGVYVTNSEDAGTGLELWLVSPDGSLEWRGFDFWYLDTLDQKPANFEPASPAQTAQPSSFPAYATGQPAQVAEPSTGLGLAVGILLLLRRHRRGTIPPYAHHCIYPVEAKLALE